MESWEIPGMENAYAREYFHDFTYVSDSRMHWREDVTEIIKSNSHDRLQLLTHPFWYREYPLALPEMLDEFIGQAQSERVLALDANFSRLDDEIGAKRLRAAQVVSRLQDETFETERLALRHLRLSDADDMFDYTKDPEVCRFLNWGPYVERAQAASWIEAKLAKTNPTDVLCGIEEKATARLVGVVRIFNIDSPEGTAELSYILNPACQGKGYMTEACRKALEICFEILRVNTVYACIDRGNAASARVARRLGMEEVAELAFEVNVKGALRPHGKYAIRRSSTE